MQRRAFVEGFGVVNRNAAMEKVFAAIETASSGGKDQRAP